MTRSPSGYRVGQRVEVLVAIDRGSEWREGVISRIWPCEPRMNVAISGAFLTGCHEASLRMVLVEPEAA